MSPSHHKYSFTFVACRGAIFCARTADCAHTFITMCMLLAISKKVVRHRPADLPGQADGNISPALLTQRQHRITGEHQRAPPSAPSAPRSPTAPHPRSEPQRPHPLRHRSTRTLNPLAGSAAAHGKPPFITQHTEHSGAHRPSGVLQRVIFLLLSS